MWKSVSFFFPETYLYAEQEGIAYEVAIKCTEQQTGESTAVNPQTLQVNMEKEWSLINKGKAYPEEMIIYTKWS
ncbi:hypothetical protein U0X36_05040 [Bacillus thuringiensis]|uniref:hypothetical protein n=1 Tax=Bacillus thuringiensis TaxID=1428 RepID=UPI000ED80914|nr:hypothetical protein [Bacillus thuringiensis]MDZ3952315.1 hypothetical protein [Bacillus thuringiensis]RGP43727.1 hypothetical protein BTW32_29445 [Bacillus thuringiensis]